MKSREKYSKPGQNQRVIQSTDLENIEVYILQNWRDVQSTENLREGQSTELD